MEIPPADFSSPPAVAPLTNKQMAALLFNIATVLRDQGNQNPWRTRAYERAARALMGLPAEAAQTIAGRDDKRVPFGAWQHIGKKLHAKIAEMVQSGSLAQFGELLGELPPHQAALMTVPGIGPRTADRIYQTLGIICVSDLFQRRPKRRFAPRAGAGKKARSRHRRSRPRDAVRRFQRFVLLG